MAAKESLIGFTLGELGLLIAFVLLFFIGVQENRGPDRTVNVDSLKERLAAVKANRDSLRSMVDSLEGLQSTQTPSCREAGLTQEFLFTTSVVGRRQFLIDDETLSWRQLQQEFQSEISAARRNNCVHQINVRPAEATSLEEYRDAIKLLRQLFYYQEL